MKYKDYSPDDLYTELYTVRQEFDEIKGQGLNLNMARGVPSKDQLELTMPMLDILKGDTECFAEDGTDCRNYGVLDGIPECKRMMADMPDSIRNTYLVPREYGFTLKRAHQAQSVGFVYSNSTLESDSPVEYPPVKRYRQWHMLNGRLILVSAEAVKTSEAETQAKQVVVLDTLDFVYMDIDSLIMTQNGKRIGFHRKENALKANDAANKAQAKIDSIKQQTK